MSVPFRLAVLISLFALGSLRAQSSPAPAAATASTDDHAARLADRYRAMLAANPVEGMALDRLWKSYEERNATSDLLRLYRDAAAAPDVTVGTRLVYGHLLKKVGRLDEAASEYDQAAKLDPASALPPAALADLATVRGQPAEAAARYADALSKLPASDHRQIDLLLKRGTALLAAGQVSAAADTWEKLVERNPSDLAVRRQLADAYEKNGLLDRAITHDTYIEAHADPAGRAAALREISRLQETSGHFDAARDALARGLDLTSRDNWLHGDLQARLIRLYQRADRVPDLVSAWEAAAAQAPRDLGGYLRLEALAEAEGDPAAQRKWLEKVVALAPTDRDSTLKLAALLTNAGERQRAAELYDGLLRRQPTSLDLILLRADLDVQLGQPAAAVGRVEARVSQNPADESISTPALNFFLDHQLHAAAERLLRAEVARQPGAPEPSLALAKFLYTQRRIPDAAAVLEALSAQPGNAPSKSARLIQVADAYKEGGQLHEALRCWQRAAELQPASPAPLLGAADLWRTMGDAPRAAAALERAEPLSPVGPERATVERKLFETLRAAGETGHVETSPTGLPAARPQASRPAPDSLLGGYLARLTEQAGAEPTAESYLRLARWQSWVRNAPAALAATDQVITLDPGNLPARELAASVAAESNQPDLAAQMLSQIVQLAPSQNGAALRQLANLKLQAGDLDEALKLFDQQATLSPGSRTALMDLALAQQRADRWFDAVATWERADALPGATPAQRAEIRRPLVAAYEHLGQFPRAVELLGRAVDEQTDASAKEDLFKQLADLAYQHGLGNTLRATYEDRLRRTPDDYFTLTALARLRAEEGEPRQAYQLLQRAHFSSPDPVRSLRGLVQAGEDLGKLDEAVVYQRRLVALPAQGTPDNLAKLAALEDNNQDPEAAARTWNEIVTRFPRDPAALEQAVAYFEKASQPARARELQRQIVALDPANLPRTLHLAELDAQAGDQPTALADYETILSQTPAEPPNQPLQPPEELRLNIDPTVGAIRVIGPSGVVRPGAAPVPAPSAAAGTPSGDEALRLQAITAVSRLLFPASEGTPSALTGPRAVWVQRWQKAADAGARNEPLCALYFAGQKDATMALLTRWAGQAPPEDTSIPGVLLTAGLRLGDYYAVGQWVWAKPGNQSQRVLLLTNALEQFLNGGGKPGSTLTAELFPPEVTRIDSLWDTARALADLHWYAPAAELGRRVLALLPNRRATYAGELAEWELYSGNAAQARAALRAAVEEGGAGTTDEDTNPALNVLREYYLLLPVDQRKPFVADYLRRLQTRGVKEQGTLAGVMLHGLEGDEPAARRDIDALLATRPLSTESTDATPDARRWSFLLSNGIQLESWNLETLAAYLWRQALRGATPFDRQFGETAGTVQEIRRRLLNIEISIAADPEQASDALANYLDTNPPTGVVSSVAGELANSARYSWSIQVFQYLCRVDPTNSEHWRSLLATCENAGQFDLLEQLLQGRCTADTPLPDGLVRTDLVVRWASVRERNGDLAGACEVLEAERRAHPGTVAILLPLAQAYERAERWEQAASVWRELLPLDPNDGAILGLAKVEEDRGQPQAAVDLLQTGLDHGVEAGRDEVCNRLVRLYLATGQLDKAKTLSRDLLHQGHLDALANIANSFVAADQRTFARELLADSTARTHDLNTRFRLQQALVGLYPAPGEDLSGFQRQLARLESFSKDRPVARNGWEMMKYKLARQAGADAFLEADLRRRWDNGKGDFLAGERLVAFYLETNRDDRLAETVSQFDHRPRLPEQLLFGIENALVKADRAPLALALSERLYRRFPQNELYALQRATVLWKSGQRDEANRVLELVEATAALRDDLTERVAQLYLGLGEKEKARDYFERVVRRDPLAVRSPGSFLQLARLYLEAGRRAEAGNLLGTAYRQESSDDFGPLVVYLAADGQLEGDKARDMPAPDLPLTFRRRAALLVAVRDHLLAAQRPADARELILRHAAFLAAVPTAAVELARIATMEDRPLILAAIQQAVDQIEPPLPRLLRALQFLQSTSEAPQF